jgi:hypothetical protein
VGCSIAAILYHCTSIHDVCYEYTAQADQFSISSRAFDHSPVYIEPPQSAISPKYMLSLASRRLLVKGMCEETGNRDFSMARQGEGPPRE